MRIVTVFALMLGLASGTAFADIKDLMSKLELTGAQKEQINAIRAKHREGLRATKKHLEQARQDLVTALQSPKKGAEHQALLRAKFKRVQALRQQLGEKRFEKALEVREVLDDQQLSKLESRHGGLKD